MTARLKLTDAGLTTTMDDGRREIVHIQAGQCGNQIGAKFWEVRFSRVEQLCSFLSFETMMNTIFHFSLFPLGERFEKDETNF